MNRFCGSVGFSISEETVPGTWINQLSNERKYYGDIIRNTCKIENTNNLNDDINVSNIISIIADPYAMENFQSIKYVVFMGIRWKVTNIEVGYPRLILTLGGVYNGQ